MENSNQTIIQAKVFEFALTELICNHRNTFKPLWTIDSWVKFLIWMNLNCGLSGDKESLELFAEALGRPLTTRMRRIFFERNLEKYSLCLMADPAESNVLVLPAINQEKITFETAVKALDEVGLTKAILNDQSTWRVHEGIITIPWKTSEINS